MLLHPTPDGTGRGFEAVSYLVLGHTREKEIECLDHFSRNDHRSGLSLSSTGHSNHVTLRLSLGSTFSERRARGYSHGDHRGFGLGLAQLDSGQHLTIVADFDFFEGDHMGSFDSFLDQSLELFIVGHMRASVHGIVSSGAEHTDDLIGTDTSLGVFTLGHSDEVFRIDQNDQGMRTTEALHVTKVGHMQTGRTGVVTAGINQIHLHLDPSADTLLHLAGMAIDEVALLRPSLHTLVGDDPTVIGQGHLRLLDELHQVFTRMLPGIQHRCQTLQEVGHRR